MKTLNEDLERLVRNSDQLDTLRAMPNPGAFTTFLKRIRDNASGLHVALGLAWNCECLTTHPTRLRLENRSQKQDPPFNLRFEGPYASKARDVKVQIATLPTEEHHDSSLSASKSVSFAFNKTSDSALADPYRLSQTSVHVSDNTSITSQTSSKASSTKTNRSSRIRFVYFPQPATTSGALATN